MNMMTEIYIYIYINLSTNMITYLLVVVDAERWWLLTSTIYFPRLKKREQFQGHHLKNLEDEARLRRDKSTLKLQKSSTKHPPLGLLNQ